MKTQQQAEKEEQQRIKNLVLNYDLRENEEQDGDDRQPPLIPDIPIHNHPGLERPTAHYHHNRMDRGKDRGGQRSRKLQLSDVDWYESTTRRGERYGAATEGPTTRTRNGNESSARQAAEPLADGMLDQRRMRVSKSLRLPERRRHTVQRQPRSNRTTDC